MSDIVLNGPAEGAGGWGGGVDEFPQRVILQHGSMRAWGASMLNGSSETTYIWSRVFTGLKMGTDCFYNKARSYKSRGADRRGVL